MQSASTRQLVVWIGSICLLLSAGLNVALAVRVAQQRTAIEQDAGEDRLQIGLRVNPFDARDSRGRTVRIDVQAEGRPTVLYTFQWGCAWCERNHEALLALHSQLSERYRFIGISLDDEHLEDMLEDYPLPFEVVSAVDRNFIEAYRLGGTPRTLVLDSQGKVEASYYGAYIGSTRSSISARFDVELPVVREDG